MICYNRHLFVIILQTSVVIKLYVVSNSTMGTRDYATFVATRSALPLSLKDKEVVDVSE